MIKITFILLSFFAINFQVFSEEFEVISSSKLVIQNPLSDEYQGQMMGGYTATTSLGHFGIDVRNLPKSYFPLEKQGKTFEIKNVKYILQEYHSPGHPKKRIVLLESGRAKLDAFGKLANTEGPLRLDFIDEKDHIVNNVVVKINSPAITDDILDLLLREGKFSHEVDVLGFYDRDPSLATTYFTIIEMNVIDKIECDECH